MLAPITLVTPPWSVLEQMRAGFQRLGTHATLANHTLDIEVLHDHPLVWLFTDTGGGSSSNKLILLGIQPSYHRTTMINDTTCQQRFNGSINFQIITLRLAGVFDKCIHH